MYGSHCIKSHSSTQATIALSSAEAEYYALVKAGSVALGLRAMYRDLGIELKLNLITDATGAKGIATRRGLGKLRHVEVHLLWLQQHLRQKTFSLHKVKGTENPADIFTKHVSSDWSKECLTNWGSEFRDGRSEAAPHSIYA